MISRTKPRRLRRTLLGAALLVTPLLVGVAALQAEAAVTAGVYQVASGASGKCIDVTSSSTADSALLIQTACTTASHHMFTIAASGSNWKLTNGNSAKCIDVPGSSTTSGTQLVQFTCGSGTTQQWTISDSSAATGKYIVKNVANGLCISDKDGSTAGNNPIVQETCSDIARMQWNLKLSSSTPPTGSGTVKTVAADGSGQYKTVQSAIDSVAVNNKSAVTIQIKAGTYREVVTIPSTKPYITLQGMGSGPANTVIVMNHWAGGGFDRGSATMFVDAPNSNLTNLTVSNDFDESTQTSGQQGVALQLDSDRSVLRNVRLIADQDTFQANGNSRTYVVDSYIEGTVDFIFSAGTVVFSNSTIHEKRSDGGVLTAASTDAADTYGFLFYKSTINGAGTNVTNLGRPWRPNAQVVYRECNLSAAIKVAQPWTDMSTNSWKNARFFEYKNTGSGATVNSNRPQLTDAQAVNYTPQKYLAGSDGWNPI